MCHTVCEKRFAGDYHKPISVFFYVFHIKHQIVHLTSTSRYRYPCKWSLWLKLIMLPRCVLGMAWESLPGQRGRYRAKGVVQALIGVVMVFDLGRLIKQITGVKRRKINLWICFSINKAKKANYPHAAMTACGVSPMKTRCITGLATTGRPVEAHVSFALLAIMTFLMRDLVQNPWRTTSYAPLIIIYPPLSGWYRRQYRDPLPNTTWGTITMFIDCFSLVESPRMQWCF